MKYKINKLVYPFNERGIVEDIKQSNGYMILKQLCNEETISKEDKQYITDKINSNGYFEDSIALLGVRICFKPFVKKFWFKSKWGDIFQQYAFNKTTLRENNKYLYPIQIIEVM